MNLVRRLGDVFLVLLVLTVVPAAVLAIQSKASFLTVTSKSMEPAIRAGDTLLTRQVSRTEVRPNQIIVLPVPDNPTLRYAHRVVSAESKAAGTIVTTKGDANPNLDSWTMRITSDEVPQVISVIPTHAVFDGPISRSTIFLSLLTIGALLLIAGLWRLVRANV